MNLAETNILLILIAFVILLLILLILIIMAFWPDNNVDYGNHDTYKLYKKIF